MLDDPLGLPVNGIDNWQSGYLPPTYQGTRFRATGSPVLNLKPGYEEPESITKLERELIARLDRIHQSARPPSAAVYEPAWPATSWRARMQLEASSALDLSQETEATQKLYGVDQEVTRSYGRRCLIARRLVERGVRFVQLFINGQIWDNHHELGKSLQQACIRTDKPVAGLLQDLKQRGLLERTLVVWGGEMGRLPIAQLPGDKDPYKAGRDHNKNAICTWMAGGGVRGGLIHGTTDELGFAAVGRPGQRRRLARHDTAPARPASSGVVLRAPWARRAANRSGTGTGLCARFWREPQTMSPLLLIPLLAALDPVTPPITAAAFTPDGKQVVVGSQSGIELFSWPALQPRGSLPTRLLHIHDLEFSPEGTQLAAAGGRPAESGEVELFGWARS